MREDLQTDAFEVLRLLARSIVPADISWAIAQELFRNGLATDSVSGIRATDLGKRVVEEFDQAKSAPLNQIPPRRDPAA